MLLKTSATEFLAAFLTWY